MKVLILIATLVVAASALTSEEENQLFESYIRDFNIRIGRSDNINKRKQRFIQNYNNVQAHNAAKSSFTLEINEFAHLSEAELAQKTGYTYHPQESENITEYTPGRGIRADAQYDWTKVSGMVQAVQNQGDCGSCWAFAAIGAIEGQMMRKKGRSVKLSEQEIIECARSNGVLRGCNGGWDGLVYDHARLFKGVTTATNTPRTSGSTVTKSYSFSNEASIKEALFIYGPLYIIFNAVGDFNYYKSGVYTDPKNQCGNNQPNHAVLLVGYGTENGIPFWRLKNSWGTGWGDRGYFKIRRGINLCQIGLQASFPILA